MPEKCFLDTNILLYAHDKSSKAKRERAIALVRELWASGTGVLSTQVLQELCVNLRRKFVPALGIEEIRGVLRDYMAWEIFVNNANSVLEALEIESQYKISFWDALIIQAAEHAGATILYSEDLKHGQNYRGVRVVNPFAS